MTKKSASALPVWVEMHQWKCNALHNLNLPLLPAYFATWATFCQEFHNCFADPQECECTMCNLMNSWVTQTTSIHLFTNKLMEECDRARYMDDEMHMDFLHNGLKPKVVVKVRQGELECSGCTRIGGMNTK
jgi:hypothetical protein